VSGAGTSAGLGTVAFTNNSEGAVTGFYTDSSGVLHGFIRSPHEHHDDDDR
jgi:hypothetical protein